MGRIDGREEERCGRHDEVTEGQKDGKSRRMGKETGIEAVASGRKGENKEQGDGRRD